MYDVRKDALKLKFNCQLINLVLALYCERVDCGYVKVIGSDYAGFWQEQLIWRHLTKPMIIVYTPLISDWSGSKVSKSLYLQEGAYDYLRQAKQEYLLSYKVFQQEQRDIGILWQEVEKWVDEPYRLFLGYSLQYMHMLYNQKEIKLGIRNSFKGAERYCRSRKEGRIYVKCPLAPKALCWPMYARNHFLANDDHHFST